MPKTWNVFYRGNRWIGKRVCRWAPMGTYSFWVLTGTGYLRIASRPYRGLLVTEGWSFGASGSPARGTRLWTRWRTDVKKVKLSDRASVKHLAAMETEYLKDSLAVVEHLAMLQYEDGTPRQTGYLGVWSVGMTWFVRIQDKDADASLTCEGRTLDEALDNLTLQLGSENAPWEPNQRKKRKGG